jgi:plasmid maintenance system antidote protein VapI
VESTLLWRTNTPRLSPPLLRVCPACIEDDCRTNGWPYFHRTHQLRSRACPHHWLLLQDSCVCGQVIRSSNEPTLFPIRCKCGANLTSTLKREEANAAWRTLAEFSHKVLYALPGELNIVHLAPYAINHAVKQKNLSISSSVQRILTDSYGIDGLEWLCRRPGVQGDVDETQIRTFTTMGLPPHLAVAILASCRIDFNEAKEAVAEQSSLPQSARLIPKGSRGPRKIFVPENVSEAKRLALSFTTNLRERGKLKPARPFVYWMLYLLDRQWLYDWMHESGRRTVACWDKPPDIAEDRAVIINKGAQLARQAARARAYTRDRAWLELNDRIQIQATDRANTILTALSTNKEQYFAELGRPKKWTIPEAAKRLRMPRKTLSGLIQRDERIRTLVPELSHEYLLRVIDWAITECLRMGISLTPTRVVKIGKLLGNSKNMKVIAGAIEKRRLR